MRATTLRDLVALSAAAALAFAGCGGGGRDHRHERRACVVSEAETRRLYDQLVPVLRGKDCAFSALDGEPQRLRLALEGAPAPLLVGHPGCLSHATDVGPHYELVTPVTTASRCPASVQALRAALSPTATAH